MPTAALEDDRRPEDGEETDWAAWADRFTDDATHLEHHDGRLTDWLASTTLRMHDC